MKIKLRFENEMQTLEVDTAEAAGWVSLKVEDYSEEDLEEAIQERIDEAYNRPEYNIYHRETRHIDPTPMARRFDGKVGYIKADPEEPGFDIMDYLATTSDEEVRNEAYAKDEICRWIRQVLVKKPEWAEAFIAVRMNDESIRDYARRTGSSENSITQKLKRAAKKLAENYRNRQI